MPDSAEELESAIKDAEKLHGHLGPFLVIGVRMGNIAKRVLNPNREGDRTLEATVRTQPLTPFSCVIDGVQATTQCTVGNQRLRIEKSPKEISARFKLQNSEKTLTVSVNSEMVEDLTGKIAEGFSNEELAREIARTPEKQLFAVEKR